jgi:hypothetical protein
MATRIHALAVGLSVAMLCAPTAVPALRRLRTQEGIVRSSAVALGLMGKAILRFGHGHRV